MWALAENFINAIKGDIEYLMEPLTRECGSVDIFCEGHKADDIAERAFMVVTKLLSGVFVGFVESIWDTVKLVWDLVTNPGGTIKSMIDTIKSVIEDPKILLQMFAGEVERITDLSTEDRLYEFGKIYGSFLPDVIIGALTAGGSAAGSISKKLVDGLAKSSKLLEKTIDFSKFVGKKLKIGKKSKVDIVLKQVGDGVGISGKDMKRVLGEMDPDERYDFIQQIRNEDKRNAVEYAMDSCTLFAYGGNYNNKDPGYLALIGVQKAQASGKGCIRITKSSNYRDKLLKELGKEETERMQAIFPEFPDGIDANHRFPEGMFKNKVRKDALRDALEEIGIDDINDPKVMEMMIAKDNRGSHQQLWRKYLDEAYNKGELNGPDAGEKILEIMKKVETDPKINYNNVGRPPNAIDMNNYVK